LSAGTPGHPFQVAEGDARGLQFPDESFDIVLMMGPLYHLVERAQRDLALAEAKRVLRPAGVLLGEVVTRRAWLMDAARKGLLATPGIFDDFELNERTGASCERSRLEAAGGGFWAHFHRLDELADELASAGFEAAEMVGVEGFAFLLGNLGELLANQRGELVRALAMTEKDPDFLEASPHVDAVTRRPLAQRRH
jgi:SAM-dependent methyltransferase